MKPGADEAIKIIIELNTAAPSFEGLHDITMTDLPPRRKVSDQFLFSSLLEKTPYTD